MLWYRSDSAQLTISGPKRGTLTARVPPRRSTRASSAMAEWSSGRCSSTSAHITLSKAPSGNGSLSASPLTATPAPLSGTSPASTIALMTAMVEAGEVPESGADHALHLDGVGVERHHHSPAAEALEGMSTGTASEI